MWTSIAKPGAQTYTTVNPMGKEQYDQASLTYDDVSVFYDGTNPSQWTDFAKPVLGPAALVQSVNNYNGSNSIDFTFASPVSAGNLLVACISTYYDLSTDDISISDSMGHQWTLAKTLRDASQVRVLASIYYTVTTGSGTPTVTATMSGINYDLGGSVYEYSGINGIINNSNSTVTSGTAFPTASSLTTTAKTVIIAMAAQENAVGTFGACGGGFTLRNNNGTHIDGVADAQNVAAGTYASSFSFNFSPKWIILQVAFTVGGSWTDVAKPT